MSLERMHTMLKLLIGGSGNNDARFDMSLAQLRQYMQTMVDRNFVDIVDGLYMACKK
jgi:hypothetical protein